MPTADGTSFSRFVPGFAEMDSACIQTTAADHKLAPATWSAFENLCEASMRLVGLFSQLAFISQQRSAGPLFTLVVMVRPLLTLAITVQGDIIAGDIAGWITSEYHRARDALGDVVSQSAWSLYGVQTTPIDRILAEWAGALPTLYWAISAMLAPAALHVFNCNLQQYSSSLRLLAQHAFLGFLLSKSFTEIKVLYEAGEVKNQIIDGERIPAPRRRKSKGMKSSFGVFSDMSLLWLGY
ncbi:hypothetical protein MSAN_00613300 [Mycena sanguinolenta]|uniref:Uncharacterized protein n=1 Tax=Mycena sanguinolenta TaxID=230812 RepID=A0A8H6YZD2_9AGAR|nr:hypothetical protein MSAN_00613300 [Mycena sanguinolenta]